MNRFERMLSLFALAGCAGLATGQIEGVSSRLFVELRSSSSTVYPCESLELEVRVVSQTV